MNAWTLTAARAAQGRYDAGRAVDATFVGELEQDAVTTVEQGGGDRGDVRDALEGLHNGLAMAAGVCPACGALTRPTAHGAACVNGDCADPWSSRDGVVHGPPRHLKESA